MKLPGVEDFDLFQKKVLVRADLDVDIKKSKVDKRLELLLPTLEYLISKQCEIVVMGHKGRPKFEANNLLDRESFSLEPVSQILENLLKEKWGEDKVKALRMQMMENLRFNKGEEVNDPDFAKCLAEKGDFYINESFANSHREHASIVGIPKYLPHAAGFRFIQEVDNLSKIFDNPKKPLIFMISGVKEDKLSFVEKLTELGDKVLVAGRLPDFIPDQDKIRNNNKVVIAGLLPDKEDITIHSIEKFEEEIAKAGTIVIAGPIGKYEEEGHRMGTKRVFEAVAESLAFKVAGGGDTEEAISGLNLTQRFNWISVGGGAMLEFLSKGTLPGIQALLN
jgi:3-phosphoglycerate kinase